MLYMVNSNASLEQCLNLLHESDSVIVFADSCIDADLLEKLCEKINSVKIVDNDYAFTVNDYDIHSDRHFSSLKVSLRRVKSQEAALFIAMYKGKIVSLM